MSILNLTSTQLRHAADLKEQIATLEQQLAGLIKADGQAPAPATTRVAPALSAKPAKRTISAAHIAKIKAAQKLRWARYNAAKAQAATPQAAAPAAQPGKRGPKKMSAAARAKIAAAQRARWAKQKGLAKPAATAAPKSARKGKMSAAGKARIIAAQKARWAAFHAAKGKK
jgi:hypothetical protein